MVSGQRAIGFVQNPLPTDELTRTMTVTPVFGPLKEIAAPLVIENYKTRN